MTSQQFKDRIAKTIIILNITVILLLLILNSFQGGGGSEFTTILGIIMPITTIHFGAVIKNIIENRYKNIETEEKKFNLTFIKISNIIIFSHYSLIILLILINEIDARFMSFETYKNSFAIIESLFGVYVGLIISSLFENK